ncbi:hypothetical protein H2200_011567 [Cladophialophora chaetospira]|uniref:SprT-like domain-containing protein n=1 Tax=Cladophialophora chaetospira TaxID=386627 RepID=A0AA38WZK6_9EURO|nr:hypothetical protein H2200_011567 [Cladophialophora chaetospira]
MSEYLSENDLSDLPDLDVLFPPKPLMATGTAGGLRRSPRKETASEPTSPQKTDTAVARSPKKRNNGMQQSPTTGAPNMTSNPSRTNTSLKNIPLLPRNTTTTETQLTSNNRRSPYSPQRSQKLAHVDSISLSLKALSMKEDDSQMEIPRPAKEAPSKQNSRAQKPLRLEVRETQRKSTQTKGTAKQKPAPHYTSRFVLKEAHCNDDEENSNDEEEDEDTDLSGFIVDDNAEISFYNSSAAESDVESDHQRKPPKPTEQPAPRRRLQRGSPTRRRLDFGADTEDESDKENRSTDMLANGLKNVSLGDKRSGKTKGEIEVIDLTSSPVNSPKTELGNRSFLSFSQDQNVKPEQDLTHDSNPFKSFDAILRLAPPSSKPEVMVPSKELPSKQALDSDDDKQGPVPSEEADRCFTTPPATPPRSPSKLKSPSKLLSPSKRQAIPHSPHRQSMDAFWDHNVINEWNDEYSPKKGPAASPRKGGLARFQLWSDSEDEAEDDSLGSSDSLPSPCLSPSKPRSPMKSPEKEEKKRLVEQKRAAAAAKKAFDSSKEQLALDLFYELDDKIAKGQLAKLSSTTGGVKIIWSKTLRSTAGRANWKRTVTKFSGSPVKGNPSSSDAGVKVQHFASIELAEKIIDCEDRLVNTLAHEFCHLTNFMVSNVKDQPHGTSFKNWAQKVTSHLRGTNVASWRKVEVTTKHSYVINHKYLWGVVGAGEAQAESYGESEEDEDEKGRECGE